MKNGSRASLGTGSSTYSSRYPFSFDCATIVNERVDTNAEGALVLVGSKSYGEGTLDNAVVKAKFIFKFGELNKPLK